MALYKRGAVWWYDFTDAAGERRRGSTRQTDKRAAERIERSERDRAALGEIRAVPSLREAAAAWFTARAEGRKSVVTIARRIKVMLRLLGPDTPVSEIGPREIAAAQQVRRYEVTRQGRAPTNATVNRDLIDTPRPILRYAKKVMEAPVREIDWADLRLPEPKGRSRAFTPTELAAFRNALPDWHRPVFSFAATYGLRLAELFFHPDAVDPENMEVTVRHRKNGLPVVAELTEADAADLAARATRARAAGLMTVWFRDIGGDLQPIRRRGFQSACQRALLSAGIADARPVHDLRHHAGTNILRLTGDLTAVQDLLGHESIVSSRRYAHSAKGRIRAALSHAIGTVDQEQTETPANTKSRTGT